MAIEDLMAPTADAAYYDEKFRLVIEDHIEYLRAQPDTTISTVTSMDLYVYAFDFYGMLIKMGVPPDLHYATMRLAGLGSPQDPFGHLERLFIPSSTTLGKILQRYSAKKRL